MKILIRILFVLVGLNGLAQELTLEQAITIALQNNHNIQIQKNQIEIAKNQATIGNADLLPKVDISGNYSVSQSKTDIQFVTDPAPQKGLESESKSSGLSANLSYTLFDGFGNIRTYQKLQEQEELAEVQTRLNIESTLMQVINGYFEVLRNQTQLEIVKNTLSISKDRLARLEGSYKYGSGNKIDILNAEVDFNTDSANFLNTKQALENAKYNLNYLLGRDIETNFEVVSSTINDGSINYESVKSKAISNNANILLSQTNLSISELDKKINQSRYMPIVAGSLRYGYSGVESTPSVVLSNKSLGLTGALTLTWNLFDGNKKRIALQNAKISMDNNELLRQQAVLSIDKELANYYGLYENNKSLVNLETQNLEVANLNLQRSKELFQQGQITNVDFRQAQLNLLNTQSRLNNAVYAVKITEYEIKRLAGELIQ
jgi:outer membrane protein